MYQVASSLPSSRSFRFLPFLNGKYEVKPGLQPLPLQKKVFLLDNEFPVYLQNKWQCRRQGLFRYYCRARASTGGIQQACRFIYDRLLQEYPKIFGQPAGRLTLQSGLTADLLHFGNCMRLQPHPVYTDAFDALCMQIQEDVAVWQLTKDRDWLALVHLCAPNHWSPSQKAGKNFDRVHAEVPGMEKIRKNYRPMLQHIVSSGQTFTRFAWGVSDSRALNCHPLHPAGRHFNQSDNFFVRVERQTLTGLPDAGALVFTIRTFFYNFNELDAVELQALEQALAGMGDKSRRYKGLLTNLPAIQRKIARCGQ